MVSIAFLIDVRLEGRTTSENQLFQSLFSRLYPRFRTNVKLNNALRAEEIGIVQ